MGDTCRPAFWGLWHQGSGRKGKGLAGPADSSAIWTTLADPTGLLLMPGSGPAPRPVCKALGTRYTPLFPPRCRLAPPQAPLAWGAATGRCLSPPPGWPGAGEGAGPGEAPPRDRGGLRTPSPARVAPVRAPRPVSEAPGSEQKSGLWETCRPRPLGHESCPVSPADLAGRGSPEWPSSGSMAEPISWQRDTNGRRIKRPRPILIWTATVARTGRAGCGQRP